MEELEIIQGVLISIVAAAVMGYLMQRLRQPVIMGYIIAGIVIGPELGLKWVTHPDAINFTSELGLIALMFMVGLELDIRQIKKSGKSLIFLAVLQFAVCAALGFAFFKLPGFSGGGEYAALYMAIVFALSSTMIVVTIVHGGHQAAGVGAVPGAGGDHGCFFAHGVSGSAGAAFREPPVLSLSVLEETVRFSAMQPPGQHRMKSLHSKHAAETLASLTGPGRPPPCHLGGMTGK